MSAPSESSPAISDDRELTLVRAAGAGDEAAFAALYEAFLPRIYGYVQRRLGSHADAEDVTQEILIEVFRGLSTFRGEAPFAAWVFAIVRRVLARHFTARAAGGPLADPSDAPVRAPSPEERAHARGVLRRTLLFLERRHQVALQALGLQLGSGLALRAVAQRLGRTEHAVKASVRRVRAELRAGACVAARAAR